ncbi:glucoamylase family protein [Cyclobacterium sp.]|uniref:glucoamylase family protein n=1 Tax=Cyclobacterium sp. TaxID=1966343 RepID=UPI0019C23195|nr:glucoamylase family protein [Cyclobacterium sp.]MBD3630277.1 Ig-like domain-containing protein [Cyclobacterium sp.]
MKYWVLLLLSSLIFWSCQPEEKAFPVLELTKITIGEMEIQGIEPLTGIPVDQAIHLYFNFPLSLNSVSKNLLLTDMDSGEEVPFNTNFLDESQTIRLLPVGLLKPGTTYKLEIHSGLTGENGQVYAGGELVFTTLFGAVSVQSFVLQGADHLGGRNWVGAALDFQLDLHFSGKVVLKQENIQLDEKEEGQLPVQVIHVKDSLHYQIRSQEPLKDLRQFTFTLSEDQHPDTEIDVEGFELTFYTDTAAEPKFPLLDENTLLDKVQSQTFRYFWDFAHPVSGMARERSSSGDLVTTGGSGFGIMALVVGMERGFISREQGLSRLSRILDFLQGADRFHGVWPHWMNGNTGKTIPFSTLDNGGDLVETALLMQGLLTISSYLDGSRSEEKLLQDQITQLWEEVEWDWYTRGGQNRLFWHWSPDQEWAMNLPVSGYNEALIVYILAAASPTHPIEAEVYHEGWARNGAIQNGQSYNGFILPLGQERGGPLFFAHYSFLGLDPRNLADRYADYWEQNRMHSLINRAHCIQNPQSFVGYGAESWGLTASDNPGGYAAHSPTRDLGVITPTAALSSMPYTPRESMEALEYFYYQLGDRLWGEMGFLDAFDLTKQWFARDYLAIDQGPIVIMIENYRTGLLWNHFMQNKDIQSGLEKLDFTYE